MKKVRQSNFELLRIIAMLFIILHHFSYHGGVINLPIGPGKYAAQLLLIGGRLGVSIFMLISSYFLIETKFSIKRVIRIWFEILFYSVVLGLIGYFMKVQTFTYKTWLQVFLPTVFNAAWFASAYLFICFISPFLNRLIHSMNKQNYIALLCVPFFFMVVVNAATFVMPQRMFFNSVSWFVCLYLLAGYIKRFSIRLLDKKTVSLAVFVISLAALWGSQVLFLNLGKTSKFFAGSVTYFIEYESIFMLLAAVSIFMLFKNINLGTNKIINAIAASAFGVYLIHDNNVFRAKIWRDWIKTQNVENQWWSVLLYGLIAAVIIYAFCWLIDRIRVICIEKPLFSIKKFDYVFAKFDRFFILSDEVKDDISAKPQEPECAEEK